MQYIPIRNSNQTQRPPWIDNTKCSSFKHPFVYLYFSHSYSPTALRLFVGRCALPSRLPAGEIEFPFSYSYPLLTL